MQDQKAPKQPPGGWTKHAPAGGITVGGQYFDGGTFIPNEIMEKASPEELQELKKREALVQQYGAAGAKKMLKGDKGGAAQPKVEQVGIKENVYIIDDGTLLGGDKYGDLIIKKGPLLPEDLAIARSLKSNRVDCIADGQVTTYISPNATWEHDAIKHETTDLHKYDLLNNLTPPMKQYFTSPKAQNITSVDSTSSSTDSSPKATSMSLYRMSLIKKDLWEVEDRGVGKVLQVDNTLSSKEVDKLRKLHDLFGITLPEHTHDAEGILFDTSVFGETEPFHEPHLANILLGGGILRKNPVTNTIIKLEATFPPEMLPENELGKIPLDTLKADLLKVEEQAGGKLRTQLSLLRNYISRRATKE